jgi:hypothetical protein
MGLTRVRAALVRARAAPAAARSRNKRGGPAVLHGGARIRAGAHQREELLRPKEVTLRAVAGEVRNLSCSDPQARLSSGAPGGARCAGRRGRARRCTAQMAQRARVASAALSEEDPADWPSST